jgi:hypothetical protein
MLGANDGTHVTAMEAMMEIMKSGGMDPWVAERKAELEEI